MDTSRFTAKTSILKRLNTLQTRGCYKLHHNGQFLVDPIVQRRFIGLHDVVDRDVLLGGHIFLGFSKDGQFIISYTQVLQQNELPQFHYLYYLHWWEFVPFKPLKKVSKLLLFGSQQVLGSQQGPMDLYISVCQWPTDDTVIAIFGSGREDKREGEDNFLTITAIPPLHPCVQCTEVRALEAHRKGYTEDGNKRMCLRHSFTVHTKYTSMYSSVPSVPNFSPFLTMTINRHIIINTDDNIVLIKVGIDDHNIPMEPTSSCADSQSIVNAEYVIENVDFSDKPWSKSTSKDVHHRNEVEKPTSSNMHHRFLKSSCVTKQTHFYSEANLHEELLDDSTSECQFQFDVLGSRGTLIRVNQNDVPQGQMCLKIEQMFFDLEMCCDQVANKICISSGLLYQYLFDYDASIVSLCPFSETAVVIVSIVFITGENEWEQKKFCSGFQLHWDVNTGHYTVICIGEMQELTTLLIQERKNICKKMPHSMFIAKKLNSYPVPFSVPRKSPHIMTNELVFDGRSLRFLVAPTNDAVLVNNEDD